jgi:class 3 adenylate cyclase/tetratricopeptide (TPR) repeat protein
MWCLRCNAPLHGSVSQCASCGEEARLACAACRTRSLPGARFCAACGQSFDHASAQFNPFLAQGDELGDRRQLTVLFSDLVDSVVLSTQLDPEDLRQVMVEYQRCCAQVIERNGGFVARYMGDGILAYFGYPVADEADADRAIRAGLSLVEEVRRLGVQDVRLQTRVGIATGLVIVGYLIGRDASLQRGAAGISPNLAARLQAVAEPNSVVISSDTKRLVGRRFNFRGLGPLALKGFSEPVSAWTVLGESVVHSRLEAMSERPLTSLVGRHDELDLLLSLWERARSGEGQVVLVTGEPGIGKSRIAESLADRVADGPHARLRWFCSPHHRETALYPCIAHLARAAGFESEDSPDHKLRKLRQTLIQVSPKLEADVPLLAELLSVPVSDHFAGTELTPRRRKEKTHVALLNYVAEFAAHQPVLAICEDLHWADPTFLELLAAVVEKVRTNRILLVITLRQDVGAAWAGEPHVTTLPIERLSREDSSRLAVNVVGKSVASEIVRQIVEKSDGIPLFIEELTKNVLESDALEESGDRYVLSRAHAYLPVPVTLRDSLVARLDRLGPVREVAYVGAAIGRIFTHELLAAVLRAPEEQLQCALGKLIQSELVFRHGTGVNTAYRFKHALVRDAAYDSLLKDHRRTLHARIAAAIEERFPTLAEAEPEALGRHHTEAGAPVLAIPYWRRAGLRAAGRAAHLEAADHFRKAIQLLPSMPDLLQQTQLELDLQMHLGLSVVVSRGYSAPEVQTAYDRAWELCKVLGNTADLYGVLRGLSAFYLTRGRMREAIELAIEGLRVAEASADLAFIIEAHTIYGYVMIYHGEFQKGRASMEHALKVYSAHEGDDLRYPTPQDPVIACLSLLSSIAWMMGDLSIGHAYNQRALDAATALDRPFDLTYALSFAASFETLRGNPQLGARHAMRARGIADEHGFDIWLLQATVQLAFAKTALGEASEAVNLFTTMLDASEAAGMELNRGYYLGGLAQAYGTAGLPEQAMTSLDVAINHAEKSLQLGPLPLLHLLSGELHAARGDASAANRHFLRALELSRRQEARMLELRALLSLRQLNGPTPQHDAQLGAIQSYLMQTNAIEDLASAGLLAPAAMSAQSALG